MHTQYQSAREELVRLLHRAHEISSAVAVLSWDQTTYMPPGGASARARQIATLERIAHEYSSDARIGQLLDEMEPQVKDLPQDHDDAALVRVVRREYERAIRIPADFAEETANHFAASYTCWTTARPANDFAAVLPYLEKTVEFSRRYADFFPGYNHPADPLIDIYDPGMTVEILKPLFSELSNRLQPILDSITAQPQVDPSCLFQYYPYAQQWAFGKEIAERLGYDFNRGRIDATHHPYMTQFSLGDIRITTRVLENFLSAGLFGTMHEAGHAMYEQGINMDYDGTPLAEGASSGVHESQSRLWENMVGRSLPFWRHFYHQIQDVFPAQLGEVSLDTFYRAINRVESSLIRVEADEVTYNLHIIIRFQLGLQLLEGTLSVADLPEAWNEQYRQLLGIAPPSDTDGVLQDVHWYAGFIGGSFHGYTIGNILAAQFYSAALAAHPDIETDILNDGSFTKLHDWLQKSIYQHGSKFTADELVQRVTGEPISLEPYFAYLSRKFGQLYGI